MKDPNGDRDGLIAALLATGLAISPMLGWWPMVGILGAIATSIYISRRF